jgi:hypothetical protein
MEEKVQKTQEFKEVNKTEDEKLTQVSKEKGNFGSLD